MNMKYIFFSFFLLKLFVVSSQQTKYLIDAKLNSNNNEISINQEIIFENKSNIDLNELYLNDWSNSYSSTESQLAHRLAEEYDRSFYFSNKAKRGSTKIEYITAYNKKVIWNRIENQNDIIKIPLSKPLNIGDTIKLNLIYKVKIADDKFTGYGIKDVNEYFLKDWFISVCPIIKNNWIKNSNLDLEELSRFPSDFEIKWTIPNNLYINSNLYSREPSITNESKKITFYGKKFSDIQFHITTEKKYKSIKTSLINFVTDINSMDLSKNQELNNFTKIDEFISSKLGPYPHSKMLISQIEYNKNPNYGLSLLPDYLRPYNDSFFHEISILKVYLTQYLSERLQLDYRHNYWIFEGVLTYMTIKYIEYFYPDYKILGKVPEIPFIKTILKGYNLSKMKFNDGFLESYEFMLRNNNHQSPLTSKDRLIKFNDEISTPGYLGVGFKFLDNYIGESNLLNLIMGIFDKPVDFSIIKKSFVSGTSKDINWFFEDYLNDRKSIDFKFEYINVSDESITLKVIEKSNKKIPYKIGLIKDDSLISYKWIDKKFSDEIKFTNINPDFIGINSDIKFPEKNHRNNFKKINNSFNWKSLDFKFVKDLENPKKNQLFYNPITDFNAYDGLILGFRLHNKTFKNKPSSVNIIPLYSSLEKKLIGTIQGIYNFHNEESSNFLTQISLRTQTYHYAPNLRYSTYKPTLNFVFRPDDFRSDIRKLLSFSWLSVNRDRSSSVQTDPNYGIGIIEYMYSGKGAIKYKTFKSQLQLSKIFSKLTFTAEYRRILKNARQISLRLFIGKFLNYDYLSYDKFFDFSLNRASDYLFEYNYLGRSEEKGIYSQQFIMSEGGFKSKFLNPLANDYIVSSNLGIGLWKWVELYADFGISKNIGSLPRGYYDSGIRLNLLPDFLEIFLPIQSSENQIEFNNKNYLSSLRFVIALEPKTLLGLFNRKWF